MSKTDKYQTREDIDELENLSERLALDLRKHIRGLVCIMMSHYCLIVYSFV